MAQEKRSSCIRFEMVEEAFLVNRDLFRGLYLEDRWDWSLRHPVIHISFGSGVIRDVADLGALASFSRKTPEAQA